MQNKSALRKIFDWEGVSFLTFLTIALALLTLPNQQWWSRVFFMLAGCALALKIALNVKAGIYPRLLIAVLAAVVVGSVINRVNRWVDFLEFEELSKPTPLRVVSPKIHASLKYEKAAPLVRQDAFSTLIPFVTEEYGGIVTRASIPPDSNQNDPLFSTYSDLEGISFLPPEVGQQLSPTDDDMKNFLGRVLQYYILQSISEMQYTITKMNYDTEKGATTATTSAVTVPDETIYPKNELDKLLATTKIRIWPGGLWVWKSYPLKVPKGTIVSFSEALQGEKASYGVRFVRTPDCRLYFKIEPSGRNQGRRTFPKGFVPLEQKSIKDAYTYVFVVNLDFEWKGSRADGEPYLEWAQGLFSGLRKNLVIPN
jgi:hypothetical protein